MNSSQDKGVILWLKRPAPKTEVLDGAVKSASVILQNAKAK